MTSGRMRSSSPPWIVCCSMKSQYSIIPASSTTRFSCSSPQRPRTPGRLSASVSGASRRADPGRRCRASTIRCISCAPLSTRRRSESLISRSTCSSVFAIGASRSSIAFLRASMSPAASVRASRMRRFGQREERFVVGFQRVGAERLKRVAQLGFGVLVGREPLGVNRAIFLELGLQPRLSRPGRRASRRSRRRPRRWRARHVSVMTRVRGSMDISIACSDRSRCGGTPGR